LIACKAIGVNAVASGRVRPSGNAHDKLLTSVRDLMFNRVLSDPFTGAFRRSNELS
jgi:hypothetical protein